jgi:hypothetical protein
MMQSGAVEVQGSASAYALVAGGGAGLMNSNVGGKVGIGVSDRYNIKMRYERYFYPSFEGLELDLFANSYFELDNKIAFNDNGRFALSLPVGFYLWNPNVMDETSGLTSEIAFIDFKPKALITFSNSNSFEFSIIPKCHFNFAPGLEESLMPLRISPAISFGAGFSTDLDKWAIRPEIGLEQFFISGGVGFSYYFGNERESTPSLNESDQFRDQY